VSTLSQSIIAQIGDTSDTYWMVSRPEVSECYEMGLPLSVYMDRETAATVVRVESLCGVDDRKTAIVPVNREEATQAAIRLGARSVVVYDCEHFIAESWAVGGAA